MFPPRLMKNRRRWDLVKIFANRFSTEDLWTPSCLITMEPISAWHFYPAAKDFTSRLRQGLTVAHSSVRQLLLGPPAIRYLYPGAQEPSISCQAEVFRPGWGDRGGVREILIKTGGFTHPAAASLGICSMNHMEEEEEEKEEEEECFLPKLEIRESDRPNTLPRLRLYEGWRWGLWHIHTLELVTQNYQLRKHFAALIAQFRSAGGRGTRQSLTPPCTSSASTWLVNHRYMMVWVWVTHVFIWSR